MPYTYDAENRLISVYNSAYGTYEYAYDALGHRVEKLANNVAQEYYLFDLADREVTRLNASGNWVTGEVYAGGKHLATYGDSTTTFDHADWLGTERARTNVSAALCESMLSLPFGDGFSTSGSCSDASPLHFTGKEHDYESNLENFGARYYNSVYGRFVTPDWSSVPAPVPYADLTNPQTLNQYVIVHDNPNTFADLDGHEDDYGGGDDTGGSADYFAILLGLDGPIPAVAQEQFNSTGQNQGQSQQATPSGNAPAPTLQPGPAPTDPTTGKPQPPPIPPPTDVNGDPTNWKQIPGSGPIQGDRWVPDGNVPSPDGKGGKPQVTWDPTDGYWTHDDGAGNRTHWGTNGVQVMAQVGFWGTVAVVGYDIIEALGIVATF